MRRRFESRSRQGPIRRAWISVRSTATRWVRTGRSRPRGLFGAEDERVREFLSQMRLLTVYVQSEMRAGLPRPMFKGEERLIAKWIRRRRAWSINFLRAYVGDLGNDEVRRIAGTE